MKEIIKECIDLEKKLEQRELELNEIMIERNNLLDKIDKAIEYIKSDGGIKLFNSISSRQQCYNYLLSILEGKEVEDE